MELPKATHFRRQQKQNGAYEMIEAYTEEEMRAAIKAAVVESDVLHELLRRCYVELHYCAQQLRGEGYRQGIEVTTILADAKAKLEQRDQARGASHD